MSAAGGLVAALAAALAPLNVEREEEYQGEISRVAYARVPLFWRDAKGRPRVLGIPFPRWARGERK